jgi:phage gpG-like protein
VITATIVGDRQLIERMKLAPGVVRNEVVKTIKKLGFELQKHVQKDYLTGPRPAHLGVVTNRLRGSITPGAADSRSRFVDTGGEIAYFVGTNVEYGALWEYGFRRKVGAGARGGPRSITHVADLEQYFAKHPPGVKAVPARPFLAPALADMRAKIISELQEALVRGMQKAMKP